jgi:hypothetical protein
MIWDDWIEGTSTLISLTTIGFWSYLRFIFKHLRSFGVFVLFSKMSYASLWCEEDRGTIEARFS